MKIVFVEMFWLNHSILEWSDFFFRSPFLIGTDFTEHF